MKKIISVLIHCMFLLIFSTIFSSCLLAQKYSVDNKKAIKQFEKALDLYKSNSLDQAQELLDKTITTEQNFIECYLLLSDIYSKTNRITKSIEILNKAVEINPEFNVNILFTLSILEWDQGLYEKSKEHIYQFEKLNKETELAENIQELKNKVDFAYKLKQNPVPFVPKNLGAEVNTRYADYFPVLTSDNQTLIFTVSVPKQPGIEIKSQSDTQEDFFISKKLDNGQFSKSENMGFPVNTDGNEGAQSISPDGKYLFFTSCDDKYQHNPHGKSYGSCDIFYSERIGNTYTNPVNIGEPINSSNWESQPSISADGKTLYFVSKRPGGYGASDIYKSSKDENGKWGIPINLGPKINTKGMDQSPFIHPDNSTLYFSSDGHRGMGRSDLFYSRKDSIGIWQEAVNLGYPINDKGEQFSLIVSTDGNQAYFSAEYDKGYGKQDLYSFELYQEARPKQVIFVKGKVYDKETKQKLSAYLSVYDLETGLQVSNNISDEKTGEFLFCLPTGKDYALNVNKKLYLFRSENFSLKSTPDSVKSIYLDIPLEKIEYGKGVVLKNIFFETNSYTLKKESFTELEKLYNFLLENKTIKIEIGGHTDIEGNLQDNTILSQNRAQAVYQYLIDKKIDKSRLTFKGYAYLKPIAGNDTPEGRALNRRTEFIIME